MATIKELEANREKLRKYDELKEWKERFANMVDIPAWQALTCGGCYNGNIIALPLPDHIKQIIVDALEAEIKKLDEEHDTFEEQWFSAKDKLYKDILKSDVEWLQKLFAEQNDAFIAFGDTKGLKKGKSDTCNAIHLKSSFRKLIASLLQEYRVKLDE